MASALVTGASRGIGRAIAIQLALDGHDVALGYNTNEQAASEVAASIRAHGRRATAIQANLAEPDAPERLIDRAQSELGPIGILVANAGGASPPTGIAGITDQAWEEMVALNLRAPFLLTRRLAPEMAAAGFGRIVLISSVAAYTGGLVGAHYAATKAGLHGLAHSLARETAGRGVTVNVLAPALVETDMLPSEPAIREALAERTPVGRLGDPGEVADLVCAVVRNGYLDWPVDCSRWGTPSHLSLGCDGPPTEYPLAVVRALTLWGLLHRPGAANKEPLQPAGLQMSSNN